MNEIRSLSAPFTRSSKFLENIVRSNGHLNALAASPDPRMPPTQSRQKLCPHGSVTGDDPAPSLQKSRRHTAHVRSSRSLSLMRSIPGEKGGELGVAAALAVAATRSRGVLINRATPRGDGAMRAGDEALPDPIRRLPGVLPPPSPPHTPPRSDDAFAFALALAHFRRVTSRDIAALVDASFANAIGVFPSAFLADTHAPRARSTARTRPCPLSAATCSGVFPLAFGAECDAPPGASRSATHASGCPFATARLSARFANVRASAGVTSDGGAVARRARRVSASPSAAAATSAAR